jgi:hypothetical protein
MWNITIFSTSKETIPVFLQAWIENIDRERIFEGTSADFSLAPNTYVRIVRHDIEPVSMNYSSYYEEIIIRTGTIPPGNYTICVSVMDSKNREVTLGSACLPIMNASPPELLLPLNESVVAEPQGLFTWLPPAPGGSGGTIEYSIRIAEVLSIQTPVEAMEANPAFFSAKGIFMNSFQMPVAANGFETGTQYAWQVTAYGNGNEIGKSQVWSFIFNRTVKKEPPPEGNCENCLCTASNWDFSTPSYTMMLQSEDTAYDDFSLNISQPLKIRSKIVMLKAGIVNFQWKSTDDCNKSNKNSLNWGNLLSGTVNNPGFILDGVAPVASDGSLMENSHELRWTPIITGDSVNFSGTVDLQISLPRLPKKTECADEFSFSVRFTITIMEKGTARSCSVVRPYNKSCQR